MTTPHRVSTSLTRLLPALVTALALGVTVISAAPQRSRPQPTPAQQAASYPRPEAAVMAERLYRAALGREGTPAEVSQLTAAIQRGNLQAQVNALVAGSEFRAAQRRLNNAQLLEQIYTNLLKRQPDTAGVNLYLPRLENQRYADVLVEIVGSPEFRDKNLGANLAHADTGLPTRLESALDCQARALDGARREASGLVFWSFDRMPETSPDGRVASGPGVDRFDDDRHLTYRCDGNDVTYVYADRGRAKGADRRLEFPSGAVRACMAAARDDAGRAITFDAAALSASDTRAEYVIGLAANTQMRVVCEMEGTRVVNIHKRH